jgi:hypothetical protein
MAEFTLHSSEPIETARYVAEMLKKLEGIATSTGLDVVAYYLAMARAEAELTPRLSPSENRSASKP